jgi:hypothetical protein
MPCPSRALLCGLALSVTVACGSEDTSADRSANGAAQGGTGGAGQGGTGGAEQGGSAGSAGTGGNQAQGPLYFIAIHNEPAHLPDGQQIIMSEYQVLQRMVAQADEVGVKLTLMFSAQWADYIAESSERHDEVQAWKAAGHEIAGHHHSVYHGNWDGYTDYSEQEALEHRLQSGSTPEPYLGTLEEYSSHLASLDSNILSGCMNDEPDMRALPTSIVYDTCLGYANHGDDWAAESDAMAPEKGINEFVIVGDWDGVQRSWLAHYQITKPERTALAKSTFDGLLSGVYGVVLHSSTQEESQLYDYLSFLNERDPSGSRSRTVREVVEGGVLPEREIPAALLETKLPPGGEPSPCGDGVCDAMEQANPTLCPQDCP